MPTPADLQNLAGLWQAEGSAFETLDSLLRDILAGAEKDGALNALNSSPPQIEEAIRRGGISTGYSQALSEARRLLDSTLAALTEDQEVQ